MTFAITANEFLLWQAQAKPGDRITYYCDDRTLAEACGRQGADDLRALRRAVQDCAGYYSVRIIGETGERSRVGRGTVALTQRQTKAGTEYIATRVR